MTLGPFVCDERVTLPSQPLAAQGSAWYVILTNMTNTNATSPGTYTWNGELATLGTSAGIMLSNITITSGSGWKGSYITNKGMNGMTINPIFPLNLLEDLTSQVRTAFDQVQHAAMDIFVNVPQLPFGGINMITKGSYSAVNRAYLPTNGKITYAYQLSINLISCDVPNGGLELTLCILCPTYCTYNNTTVPDQMSWIYEDNAGNASQFGQLNMYIELLCKSDQKLQYEFADAEEKYGPKFYKSKNGLTVRMERDGKAWWSKLHDEKINELGYANTESGDDNTFLSRVYGYAAVYGPQLAGWGLTGGMLLYKVWKFVRDVTTNVNSLLDENIRERPAGSTFGQDIYASRHGNGHNYAPSAPLRDEL